MSRLKVKILYKLGHLGLWPVLGEEDCLVVNVYTRNIPLNYSQTQELKPVMVFIHGGSFSSGSGSPRVYGPEFLMDKEIVKNLNIFQMKLDFNVAIFRFWSALIHVWVL